MAAVAPGSFLALSHATYDKMMPSLVEFSQDVYARSTASIYLRSKTEVQRFFDGLELVAPGDSGPAALAYAGVWGAEDPEAADSDGSRAIYCAVARRS
jgi:S-adenosyl methyltransferase